MTAVEYKARHGLPRGLALTSSATRAAQSEAAQARLGSPGWKRFEAGRDPVAASHARTVEAFARVGPDREAAARRGVENGRAARLARVVACPVCGAQWCGLPDRRPRVTCSDACRRVWARWTNRSVSRNRERDARIFADVMRRGRPMGEVVAEYGIGRERVRQIVRQIEAARRGDRA